MPLKDGDEKTFIKFLLNPL